MGWRGLNENHMEGGGRERERERERRTREQLWETSETPGPEPVAAQSTQHVRVHQKKKLQQATPGEPHQVRPARFHPSVCHPQQKSLRVECEQSPASTPSSPSTGSVKARLKHAGNDAQSSFYRDIYESEHSGRKIWTKVNKGGEEKV